MWKTVVVVVAALFACSLADGTAQISWSCMNHVNVTSNSSDTKYYEEYRMVSEGKTVYSLEYVHKENEFYFGLALFDVFGDFSSTDVYTNQTEECQFVTDVGLYETYVSSFDYIGDPETVRCPDEKSDCTQYCSEVKCIILDDRDKLVEDINLKTSEALFYTYIDDHPGAEIYTLECANFTAVDYCSPKKLDLTWDCAYHIHVTSDKKVDQIYDEYRIMQEGKPAFSLEYVLKGSEYYYGLVIFDMKNASNKEILTNQTGKCEVYAGTFDFYEIYDPEFYYYGESEPATCLDGKSKDCTKYCTAFKCIVVDSSRRLVKDINLKDGEVLSYTLVDDFPFSDKYDLQCDGNTYTVTNYCNEHSSSKGKPSSSVSAGSITKAACTLVLAALFVVLF